MIKSDLWIFVAISFVGAIVFGGATWALVIALKRTQSLGIRLFLGVVMAICGLIALACSACGLIIVGS